MRALSSVLCSLVLAIPSRAAARDPWPEVTPEPAIEAPRRPTEAQPAPPPPARRPTRGDWYGWQILVADGSSLMMMPIKVGYVGYFVAAPVVHFGHERWSTGVTSAGLRVVAPAVGIFAVATMRSCRGALCGHEGVFAAALGGALAMGIDAAVLAREDAPADAAAPAYEARVPAPPVPAPNRPQRPAPRPLYTLEPSISPQLTPRREIHGLAFGVAGTF